MFIMDFKKLDLKSSWRLSVIIVLAIMILAAGGLLSQHYFNQSLKPEENIVVPREGQPPEGLSSFELGEYYFNVANNTDGVYNRKLARKHYSDSIREDLKGNNLHLYQLGRIDFIEGNFLAALHKFDKQIEYFGDEIPNVYYMIGLTNGYLARRNKSSEAWQRGAEGFKKFLEYMPDSPWARTDLAWIYFAEGKYEEMIPVLEEGLKYEPNHAWLLNMYGLALFNTDRKAEAREQFLAAEAAAAKLTIKDWGRAYPGNDPKRWPEGLAEFRAVIEKNIALTED